MSDDQSLLRYWNVLRERKWVVVACTVIVILVAVVYVAVAPKTYKAQAELEVQAASASNTTLSTLPVLQASGDPTQDVLTGASLVTTQPVAARVVSALGLRMSAAVALGHVSATPIGQTSLVAVVATASSPRLAQNIANEFVTQTIVNATANMHAAIRSELPGLQSQLAATPTADRYGVGSVGQEVQSLTSLLHANDPTLSSAAPATLPTGPSSPHTSISILVGVIGGLLIGIAAAFVLHALDPRLRREEQLRERLGLPVLARIPRELRNRARPLLPSELSPAGAEGYRTLRTVVASNRVDLGSRALLVTGSAPSEGKSTTAVGLAAALAQGGASVVLLEADLRKPTFATIFGIKRFKGIERVLTGDEDIEDALVPVNIDGSEVRVLAAHPAPRDAPRIPSVTAVRTLVEDARALADFVIIDSAPLTAVIDALPFAQVCDEVIVVARLDSSRVNKLTELDDLLGQNGVSRVGVVLVGGSPQDSLPYYYTGPVEGLPTSEARPDGGDGPRRQRTAGRSLFHS